MRCQLGHRSGLRELWHATASRGGCRDLGERRAGAGWTPARNAPSTSGASLTTTRARSAGSRSSSAISRLSDALPRVEQHEDSLRAAIEDRADRGIRSAGRSSRSGRRPCHRPGPPARRLRRTGRRSSPNPSTSCSLCETRTRPTKHASFRSLRFLDARASSGPTRQEESKKRSGSPMDAIRGVESRRPGVAGSTSAFSTLGRRPTRASRQRGAPCPHRHLRGTPRP